MSEAQCKAANCVGGCRESIIVTTVRETTDVLVHLISTGNLNDRQMADLIDIYGVFTDEVKRRRDEDHRLLRRVKEAVPDLVLG